MKLADKQPQYTNNCKVTGVVDGDTIDTEIDLGYEVFTIERVRVAGIDTAETYGTSHSSKEYQRGKEQAQAVKEWLAAAADADHEDAHDDYPIVLYSHEFERGKYGRVLGDFYSYHHDEWLATWLVNRFPDVEYR